MVKNWSFGEKKPTQNILTTGENMGILGENRYQPREARGMLGETSVRKEKKIVFW